jgi:hypothetical protein
MRKDSSVGIATRLRAGQPRNRGSIPDRGKTFLLLSTATKPALKPTQPPMQRIMGPISLGVQRLGSEADHSSPCSAEFKYG